MSSRVPIFVLVIILTILLSDIRSEQESGETHLENANQQLQFILDTISQHERQRVQEIIDNSKLDNRKQRPNSKRLRWNRKKTTPNRKDLGKLEHRAFVTSSSLSQQQTNSDYINVNNYLPTPAPWWFN
ncbi:uncharacterized protein LOC27208748 [Drosophila simulans]|uniref:uncharacterized protein LOC27208748 n=1 Tax=Drosophila simulans TaxID=7240 RepID=UPI00078AE705|nr:uncharacterized protein LOC27208748 [Drosophila simulans]KMZ07475.1 uncharacterized protein Dsimw501_GD28905 [Drosophila simulans]